MVPGGRGFNASKQPEEAHADDGLATDLSRLDGQEASRRLAYFPVAAKEQAEAAQASRIGAMRDATASHYVER